MQIKTLPNILIQEAIRAFCFLAYLLIVILPSARLLGTSTDGLMQIATWGIAGIAVLFLFLVILRLATGAQLMAVTQRQMRITIAVGIIVGVLPYIFVLIAKGIQPTVVIALLGVVIGIFVLRRLWPWLVSRIGLK